METVFIITNRDYSSIISIIDNLTCQGYKVLNKRYFENVMHVCISNVIAANKILILVDANYTVFGKDLIKYALDLKKPVLSRFIISNKYNAFIQRRNANSLFGYNQQNDYNIDTANNEYNTE